MENGIRPPPSSAAKSLRMVDVNFATRVTNKLHPLFSTKEFSDCELTVADCDERISAHRFVLAASSDLLRSEFQKDQRIFILAVESISTLKSLIGFCYTGKILLNDENILAILKGAICLKMNEMLPICTAYVNRQLSTSNYLQYLQFVKVSLHISNLEFQTKIKSYTVDHFDEICAADSFCSVGVDVLSEFLQHALDNLAVKQEKLTAAVQKWYEYDEINRKKWVLGLLRLVRESEQIKSTIESPVKQSTPLKQSTTNPIIGTPSKQPEDESSIGQPMNEPEMKSVIELTPNQLVMKSPTESPTKQPEIKSLTAPPTKQLAPPIQPMVRLETNLPAPITKTFIKPAIKQELIKVVTGGRQESLPKIVAVVQTPNSFEMYGYDANMKPLSDAPYGKLMAPINRSLFYTARMKSNLLLFLCRNDDGFIRQIVKFSMATKILKTFPMPQCNDGWYECFEVAEIGGNLFIFGYFKRTATKVYVMQRYDSKSRCWTIVPHKMPCARITFSEFAAASYQGELYVVYKQTMKCIWHKYSPATNQWVVLQSLVFDVSTPGNIILSTTKRTIQAFVSTKDSVLVFRYTPSKDKWKQIDFDAGDGVIHDIYAFKNNQETFVLIMPMNLGRKYDEESEQWIACEPLDLSAIGHKGIADILSLTD